MAIYASFYCFAGISSTLININKSDDEAKAAASDRGGLQYFIDEHMSRVLMEVFYRFLCVMIFQTFFTYMFFFYNVHHSPIDPSAYIDIIAHEYALRTQTLCSFVRMADNAGTVTVFFNWL